jgi:hypothetical protein
MGQFPTLLSVRWYHSPPPEHEHGSVAALAAICAESHGEFEPLHSKLFEFADSLASWRVTRFADEASLRNAESMEACMLSQAANDVLAKHRALALATRAIGTPTILVDSAVFLGMNKGLRKLLRKRLNDLDAQGYAQAGSLTRSRSSALRRANATGFGG